MIAYGALVELMTTSDRAKASPSWSDVKARPP
jgi:hypothetical protein